jgi:molybdopterin-guanine dinucleotide biosynthesis protein A
MMDSQLKITGVILAGGMARRMNNQDKGLVLYNGQPLVSYAIKAISPVVSRLLINANRNQTSYQQFGCPVIADQTSSFDGPLAGVLSAMLVTEDEILVVMPCDSPLIKTAQLEKLLSTLLETEAEIAVAFDGERLHPVVLALKTALKNSLAHYLASGERKITRWLEQQDTVKVDFSAEAEVFLNVNTLNELSALETDGLH